MKMVCSLLIAFASVSSLGFGHGLASAQVSITEVSSNNFFGEDWFELTNFTDSVVSLNGFYWDDDGPAGNDGAEFGDFSLNAGESLIVLQGSESEDSIATLFRDLFGLSDDLQVLTEDDFTGPDTFFGLSGGGDEISLFDTDPNVLGADFNLIDFVEFSEATEGVSFDITSGVPTPSVDGINGAVAVNVTDPDNGSVIGVDVGSPGVAVPEPGSIALSSADEAKPLIAVKSLVAVVPKASAHRWPIKM